jgi:hypothetical protein
MHNDILAVIIIIIIIIIVVIYWKFDAFCYE